MFEAMPIVQRLDQSQSVAMVQRLLEAKTIRDILELPFPYTVADLKHPNQLATYFDPEHQVTREEFHLTPPLYYSQRALTAGVEVINYMMSHDSFIQCPHESIGLLAMSGRVDTGTAVHFDFPEAEPRDIVALAVSSEGTLAVPNQVALEIFMDMGFKDFLDMRLNDKKLITKLAKIHERIARPTTRSYQTLQDQFLLNMQILPPNAINVLSGLTVHTRPSNISSDRVFIKYVTHFIEG